MDLSGCRFHSERTGPLSLDISRRAGGALAVVAAVHQRLLAVSDRAVAASDQLRSGRSLSCSLCAGRPDRQLQLVPLPRLDESLPAQTVATARRAGLSATLLRARGKQFSASPALEDKPDADKVASGPATGRVCGHDLWLSADVLLLLDQSMVDQTPARLRSAAALPGPTVPRRPRREPARSR